METLERNDRGQVMLALLPAFREASGESITRYNGGWTKTVTALDKSSDNGYSLVGEFSDKPDVLAWRTPGLYLDCDIDGSRKNQVKYYRLFRLDAEGLMTHLRTQKQTRDWAVRLWPDVESALAVPKPDRAEQIRAEIARLQAELSETKSPDEERTSP